MKNTFYIFKSGLKNKGYYIDAEGKKHKFECMPKDVGEYKDLESVGNGRILYIVKGDKCIKPIKKIYTFMLNKVYEPIIKIIDLYTDNDNVFVSTEAALCDDIFLSVNAINFEGNIRSIGHKRIYNQYETIKLKNKIKDDDIAIIASLEGCGKSDLKKISVNTDNLDDYLDELRKDFFIVGAAYIPRNIWCISEIGAEVSNLQWQTFFYYKIKNKLKHYSKLLVEQKFIYRYYDKTETNKSVVEIQNEVGEGWVTDVSDIFTFLDIENYDDFVKERPWSFVKKLPDYYLKSLADFKIPHPYFRVYGVEKDGSKELIYPEYGEDDGYEVLTKSMGIKKYEGELSCYNRIRICYDPSYKLLNCKDSLIEVVTDYGAVKKDKLKVTVECQETYHNADKTTFDDFNIVTGKGENIIKKKNNYVASPYCYAIALPPRDRKFLKFIAKSIRLHSAYCCNSYMVAKIFLVENIGDRKENIAENTNIKTIDAKKENSITYNLEYIYNKIVEQAKKNKRFALFLKTEAIGVPENYFFKSDEKCPSDAFEKVDYRDDTYDIYRNRVITFYRDLYKIEDKDGEMWLFASILTPQDVIARLNRYTDIFGSAKIFYSKIAFDKDIEYNEHTEYKAFQCNSIVIHNTVVKINIKLKDTSELDKIWIETIDNTIYSRTESVTVDADYEYVVIKDEGYLGKLEWGVKVKRFNIKYEIIRSDGLVVKELNIDMAPYFKEKHNGFLVYFKGYKTIDIPYAYEEYIY